MPKTDLSKFFCKRGTIDEGSHLFVKDEKGYHFLSIGFCSYKAEKGTLFFINFAVTRKEWQGC